MIKHPVTENDWSSALQVFEGHSKSVLAIVFSPDGEQLASASGDGTVQLRDAATGASRGTLVEGQSSSVRAVAFSLEAKGEWLASAPDDCTVRLEDATLEASRGTLEGHSQSVKAIAFSPDGR